MVRANHLSSKTLLRYVFERGPAVVPWRAPKNSYRVPTSIFIL